MLKWERPSCNSCHNKSYGIVFDGITSWEHRGKIAVKIFASAVCFIDPFLKKEG